MTITTQERLSWLRLIRSENIGRISFFRFLQIFGSAQNAIAQIPEFLRRKNLRRQVTILPLCEAERELEKTEKFGAKIILFCEENYPRLLREILDPAPLLTVKGQEDFLSCDANVAIVGPRSASFNAIKFSEKIAGEFGENKITTVSGMARGVDSAVHRASLASGTIAVIAGGIDHIYPQENARLYDAISTQGLLVSENAFGASPKSGNFVQRNRLISGLSLAVVVVEASLKSGSLITAKFAAQQGREVFAVPGSPLDLRCAGTNRLLKDGANLFENVGDVLADFSNLCLRFREVGQLVKPEIATPQSQLQKIPNESELDKISAEIFSKISFAPTSIEEIIEEMNLPSSLVNAALVSLELEEKIAVNLGKVVRI